MLVGRVTKKEDNMLKLLKLPATFEVYEDANDEHGSRTVDVDRDAVINVDAVSYMREVDGERSLIYMNTSRNVYDRLRVRLPLDRVLELMREFNN